MESEDPISNILPPTLWNSPTEEQARSSELFEPNLYLPPLLQQTLKLCREARETRLNLSAPELQNKILFFEKRLNQLESLWWNRQKATIEDDRNLLLELDNQQACVISEVLAFFEIFDLGDGAFSPGDDAFSFLNDEGMDYSEFVFKKEVLLNRTINQICYKKEIRKRINFLKHEIISKMPHLISYRSEIDNLDFKIKIDGPETHNQGRSPAYITFTLEGKEVGKVVYKPRSARADKEVINVFEQINNLFPEQKSLVHNLPTYEILNFDLGNDEVSIWKYIPGKKFLMGNKQSPYTIPLAISYCNPRAPDLAELKYKETKKILTILGIGDLHPENFIFKDMKSDDPIVVPIDLENIRFRYSVNQIIESCDKQNISGEEKNCILKFCDAIANVPSRFVPECGTTHLARLIDEYSNIDELTEKIVAEIRSQFELSASVDKISKLVLIDMLNGDVPFLTEWQGKLYYGLHTTNIVVGTVGGEKDDVKY